ncbi:MAG TPA: aminotransferase class I/II-fold pyridoxal phosphate-dependent enzyme [Ktedonobacterales bacterium]|nr:aminotransferase class I/II-fold pyridoxal phosphate-dependent enzyme [Ktedonobacterales bacterium]
MSDNERQGEQSATGRRRGFATRAIHGAHYRSAGKGSPIAFPLFQTASFYFDSAEEQEAVAAGAQEGFSYSRTTNPTTAALHTVIADLESGSDAVSFASGMGAIHAAMTLAAGTGDHILCTDNVYGGSASLLTRTLPRFGVTHSYVDMTNLDAVRAAIRPETKLLWAETIANPLTTVLDLRALAQIAHEHGALLGVDNTFASPYLARPIEEGADIVAHSATKYIGGHGDLIAGIVIGSRDLMHRALVICADIGGCAAPLEAWLMLRGLKTLNLRMERHCANALGLARFLVEQPAVTRVNYPGLPNHPQHALATERFGAQVGYGGVLSFEVKGGKEAAFSVINRVKLAFRAGSLGDTDTLISHPATISHRLLSAEARAVSGVTDSLIRVSVGLEDLPDILDDFGQALAGIA